MFSMKKLIALSTILSSLVLAVVLTNGCGKEKTAAGPSGKIASAEPTSFKEVTSKLDAGGNFYMYVSTERWLKSLSDKVEAWHGLANSVPDLQDKKEQVDNAFNVGTKLIKDSGLEEISGIGMSSIAREPGVYCNKMIVHHYGGQGNGFIWRMFGKEPHELDGLDLLPTNTAMAMFYDLDTAEIWSVIQKECEQSGFPQATEFLKEFPEQFQKGTGIKWDDAIGSLGGEFGIVVTLDESKTITIPVPSQQTLQVPEPAIMLVMKIKNDVIFDRVDQLLKQTGQSSMISVDKDGLKMRTMPVPIPILPLRPSIATSGGYLFIATSDALIQEALAVKNGKPGLKSTDEFKKLAADIPTKGNQFCFLSQRFGQTILRIQQQSLASNPAMPEQFKGMLQSFMQPDKAAFTYAVGANTDEGWVTVANGNQSSANILAASAIVPAVLAGIAVPNFVKARETAQKNTCINNLRMIDAAKQQWALEKSKSASDTPTWDDLKPYLGRGGAIPHCPKGGEYTIGSVGQHPTCSIPGHELPD